MKLKISTGFFWASFSSTVYTGFAFFEYLTVVSNITFHSLAAVDFDRTDVLMMDLVPQGSVGDDQKHGHRDSRITNTDSFSVSHVLDCLMVV